MEFQDLRNTCESGDMEEGEDREGEEEGEGEEERENEKNDTEGGEMVVEIEGEKKSRESESVDLESGQEKRNNRRAGMKMVSPANVKRQGGKEKQPSGTRNLTKSVERHVTSHMTSCDLT